MERSRSESNDASFFEVMDLCMQTIRNGGSTSIEELVERYPHLEDQIREKMPVALVLQQSLGKPEHELRRGDQISDCVLEEELGPRGFRHRISSQTAIPRGAPLHSK